ncbi:hypothetical protein U9M48_011512 [Paspalum notatum var. saurae]|uniref:Disease resistance N-terminal domain-containing protein n=1 Tax=Paspalum notatum var. saurae TaxID=547442 RepID=A0AAQ3WHM4_PASNO
MVSSVIVQETISQIVSGLANRHEGKDDSKVNENIETLEMAHIKLEAALEISEKWQITDASLLRWRKKLKRAAEECDDTLQKCKHRILEEEQMEQEVRNSSFSKRIAHATKSFISSAFGHDNHLSRSTVRRFEWFADGASDFLRFVELGCTPHCHMPFNPITKNLFTGKRLQHKIDQGNEGAFFLLWLPFKTAEHGMEATLFFIQKNGNAPENNFYFSIMLQLSESTDIVGIAFKCLQLFTPLYKSKVENIRTKLMQLPTQDFSWVPFIDSHQKEHWDNLHGNVSQWLRPNPSCCKQLDQRGRHCNSNIDMPEISLESIIEVHLQCQVPPYGGKIYLQDSQYLVAGLIFMPHGHGSSDQNLPPADKKSATSMNRGENQHCVLTDITLAQLEEITLPKAVDYFHQNTEALVYQILWKSKQGNAFIQVVKENRKMQSTQRMTQGARTRKIMHRQDQELENQSQVTPHFLIPHFMSLWVSQAPLQLQGSITNWVKKEKENKLAFPPLRLRF